MSQSHALMHRAPSLLGLCVAPLFALVVGREIALGKWQLALAFSLVVAIPAFATVAPTIPLVALLGGLFTAFLDLPALGVATLTLGDALLLGGIVACLGSHTWPMARRVLGTERLFTTGLAMLAAGALIGAVIGRSNGANVGSVIADARPLLFLGAGLIVLTVVISEGPRPFLRASVVVTVVVAGLSVAQALAGGTTVLFVADHPYDELLTCPLGPCPPEQLAHSFLRIRPPGLLVAFVALIFALSYLFWSGRRRTAPVILTLVAGSVTVVLSLNRNMLISIVLGLLVAAIAIPGRHRSAAAAAAVVVASVALLSTGSSQLGNNGVTARFASAFSVSNAAQDESLKAREQENTIALDRLREQPFVGLGWGIPYDPESSDPAKPKLWIHNQYLGLLLKTGVIGLVGWLACVFACLRRSVLAASRLEAERWLAAATAASLIALSASSLVGLYLLDIRGMSVFAALFALALALGARDERSEQRG
jgi:hypothetical protein